MNKLLFSRRPMDQQMQLFHLRECLSQCLSIPFIVIVMEMDIIEDDVAI